MRRNVDRDGFGLVEFPGAAIASVFDILSEMVIVADRSGSIRYVNSALTDTLGWAPVELVGEPITALVPHQIGPASQRVAPREHVPTAGPGQRLLDRQTAFSDPPIDPRNPADRTSRRPA